MAALPSMQAFTASSITRVTNRTWSNRVLPAATPMSSRRSMRTRSMAEDKEIDQATPSPAPPSPTPKMSSKLSDILAFGGPGPERINGRLAMIGFVAAVAVEASRGQGVFEQIMHGGAPWFVGTSVVLTLASLVPLVKGVSVESKSEGVMTSDAELWNGRFAMLGLVALAFTEYVKGSSLV